jgi:hypothetical protein
MTSRIDYINEIFESPQVIQRIQSKLPKLFQIANIESSRAGKVGMEVGVLREKIIVALFLYVFGEENVNTEIPAIEAETDVIVKSNPISIKTKQGATNSGIKLAWTVDAASADVFMKTYFPKTDIVLVQINWEKAGGFYFFPKEVQEEIISKIGGSNYIKLPKEGTNSRGTEFSALAISNLIEHKNSKKIVIDWIEEKIDFCVFDRWVELWKTE